METQLPNSVSLAFVEALYVDYLRDPESVPSDVTFLKRIKDFIEDPARMLLEI